MTDTRDGDQDATPTREHHPVRDEPVRAAPEPVEETRVLPAKTSPAAAFALAFGVAALVCVLTLVLAPLALLFGGLAVLLGLVGRRMAGRTGVTGKTVALSGLLLGLVSALLGATFLVGITSLLNDQEAVDRLERMVQDLRDN
jgi:hypothetical protein